MVGLELYDWAAQVFEERFTKLVLVLKWELSQEGLL
jgi:hypothetical protein